MDIKLLNLSSYTEDEAHGIRNCLDNNDIQYYETSRNMMDMSQATIWLKDASQESEARNLIRSHKAERESYNREKRTEGYIKGILRKYREDKKRFLSLLLILLIVIYMFASGTRHAM